MNVVFGIRQITQFVALKKILKTSHVFIIQRKLGRQHEFV